jgi:hypothetical protein
MLQACTLPKALSLPASVALLKNAAIANESCDARTSMASQNLVKTAQGRRTFAIPFATAYRRSHTNDRIDADGNTYGVIF